MRRGDGRLAMQLLFITDDGRACLLPATKLLHLSHEEVRDPFTQHSTADQTSCEEPVTRVTTRSSCCQ